MSLLRYLLALALVPVLLAPLSGRAAALYSVSFLPSGDFQPYDMNNAGQIVGPRFGGTRYYAALYDGSLSDIAIADAASSIGRGINAAGAATGVYLSASDNYSHAFVYQNGNLRDLGGGTSGYGINAQGDVVGQIQTDYGSTGFIDTNGTRTEIGNLGTGTIGLARSINVHGQVVGESTLAAGSDATRHPFLYSNGVLQDLGTLGQGDNNSAIDINDAGQIVGYSDATDGTTHAFLYDAGLIHDLGGFGTTLMDIENLNAHGRFVGTAFSTPTGDVPFVSLNGALANLNTLIDPALGWELYGAYVNNDLDQIIGGGCHEGMCGLVRLDLIGAVPEPGAAWLLVPGLLVLAVARRNPLRSSLFATAA